jgi:hypothetical protein
MEVAITFIAAFATIFGIMYVFFTSRNKERMALIEKGADASLFKIPKEPISFKKFPIKFGMFLVGIGLGIFIGVMLDSTGIVHQEEPMYAGSIIFFGGLGLVAGYFIGEKVK